MPTADITNSFVLIDYAESYFDGRLHSSTWNDTSAEDKERALIQASRILNSYVKWIATDVIIPPTFALCEDVVKQAACEMGLVLLQGDTQVKDDLEGLGSIGLSGMNVQANGKGKAVIPDHVFSLISHLGKRRTASGGSIELVRC